MFVDVQDIPNSKDITGKFSNLLMNYYWIICDFITVPGVSLSGNAFYNKAKTSVKILILGPSSKGKNEKSPTTSKETIFPF